MVTVNGWYAGGGSGVAFGDWGGECSVNEGDGERLLSKLALRILTEGVVTTEAGNSFQYFTALTENADLLLQLWL